MDFDTLYKDFSEKVLPKLQEWLVITKDYAYDLFERYITYLIIIDSLSILGLVALISICLITPYKLTKNIDNLISIYIFTGMMAAVLLAPLSFSVKNLVMDLTVPEVRVYQEFNK